MAKRIPKPKAEARCEYCIYFNMSPVVDYSVVIKPRECAVTKEEIHSTDPVCEHFKISDYFYCNRSEHRIPPGGCQARRENGYISECRGCKQWKELEASLALDPAGEKPRLKVRARSEAEGEPIWKKPGHICGDPNSPCDMDCMTRAYKSERKPVLKKRAAVTI